MQTAMPSRVHRAGGGKGEPIFISATPRKNSRTKTGTIRNVTFDNLSITCESCAFLAGEPESCLRDIRIRDLHMTFKRQGTQPGGLFDEQPSVRHVYSHAIPALYARSVKQLTVQDSTVRYADKKRSVGERSYNTGGLYGKCS